MKPFITFRGYGVGAGEITVAVARVTHFYAIDYNGNHGTEIQLDTGKEVRVRESTRDVEKALTEAQQP